MKIIFGLVLLLSLATGLSIGAASNHGEKIPWDIAHFNNDTGTEVLVYLADRPRHYYAVFGVGRGGTNNIDIRAGSIVIVTRARKGQGENTPLRPEGEQLVKSTLFIPPRQQGDRNDRHLRYRITRGGVRFVEANRSAK